MKCCAIVVVIFFTLIMLATAQIANITIPPRADNVSINGVAEFNCTAVASSIIWQANGIIIIEEMATIVDNILRSTLRVPVSSTDNATNITCTAISISPLTIDESDPALLLVQGLLESVNNLTVVSINSTTVLISWSPPFTLEGVPILGYNVTITNTTSEENETSLETANTTMLNYTFSIDHPDPDNEFIVTVVPINGAGPGDNVTTSFSFNFFDVSTSMLSSTLPLFQATSTLTLQDNSTPVIFTETVSVHVKPTLMESPTNNDSVLLGPIIGGVVGGVILIVLLFVLTPCALVCVKNISEQKDSEMPNTHTSRNSMQRLLSVHYGENPYETPRLVVFDGIEDKELSNEPSNEPSSLPMNTPPMSSSHRGDSADIRVDQKEDEHETTTNNNDVFPQSFEKPIINNNEGSDQAEHQKSVTLPVAQSKMDEKTHTYPYERKDFPIQASVTTRPKEVHYADVGAFRDPKNRPKAPPQTDNVLYAKIHVSPVPHERIYGNVGHQKRQATVHGVPSDEDIALICQRVAHKWKLLGVQLGVYPAELDQIASECGSDQSCCSELFRKWSAIEITASCPFTWKGVIEILDSESVGESPLARNLESTHI